MGGEEDKEDEESHLDTVHGRMQGGRRAVLVRGRQAALALGGDIGTTGSGTPTHNGKDDPRAHLVRHPHLRQERAEGTEGSHPRSSGAPRFIRGVVHGGRLP